MFVGRAGSVAGFAAFVFFALVISFGFVLAFSSGGGGWAACSSVRVALASVGVAAAGIPGIAGTAGPGLYNSFAFSRNDCGDSGASLVFFVGDCDIHGDSTWLSSDGTTGDTSASATT